MATVGDNAYALITVQELKDFIKATGTGQDSVLESLVNGVCKAAEEFCNRQFLARDYTEECDGKGNSEILLKQYPVNSIASLYDDPDRDWDAATLIDTDDYMFDSETGRVRLEGSLIFSVAKQNVKAIYNAGYAATPYDVKLAILGWCATVRKEQDGARWGITSLAAAGPQGGVAYVVEAIPKPVQAILQRYRKIR